MKEIDLSINRLLNLASIERLRRPLLSGDATTARGKKPVASTGDKTFAAKAAIYARTKANMRSVSEWPPP